MVLKSLIDAWNIEFETLKDQLESMGDKSNTAEYNLLSCEALRLLMCINDANEFLLCLIEGGDDD